MDALVAWVETLTGDPVALFTALFILGFANTFVPPIPMETLAIVGGVLSAAGHGNPLVVWLASSLGMSLGSTLLFGLALVHGPRLIKNRFVGQHLSLSKVESIRPWFQRFGPWTILLGKLVPGMTFATVLGCGLFGLQKWKALRAIYGVNFLYFGGAVYGGRYLGQDWRRMLAPENLGIILSVLATGAVAVIAWMAWRKRNR